MKKILFIFLLLSSFKGYTQAAFHIDTIYGIKAKYEIDDGIFASVKFVNVGNKNFYGKVKMWYKTNFNDTAKANDSGFFPIFMKPKDTAYQYTYIKLNKKYFVPGTANIIIIWPTGAGVMPVDSFKKSILITDKTTIINEGNLPKNIKFYPNPLVDKLHFESINEGATVKSAEVFSIKGDKQSNVIFKDNSLDFSGLPAGTYIIQFKLSDGSLVKFTAVKKE
ncbi:MAG: T9SS type A sorting domain-containing protein [Bacteroidetes bacterium]|nr:T9SS type A sorting domain-containing protein [Bacteroidota bacterium]